MSNPEDYEDEVFRYKQEIHTLHPNAKSLLHLGCGAGMMDVQFKKYFQIVGIDISKGMLASARKRNPELEYLEKDMRFFEVPQTFDVIAVPDSIDYMSCYEDLDQLFRQAKKHLHPGGLFLVVIHPKESFSNNNFVYTGKNELFDVTVFENNHIINDHQYQATIVNVVRDKHNVTIDHEVHTLGLFDTSTWISLFESHGFTWQISDMPDLYEDYIKDGGIYPIKLMIGVKQ